MPDIEATIARVLELDEKATPGPWEVHETGDGYAEPEDSGGVYSRGVSRRVPAAKDSTGRVRPEHLDGINKGEDVELFDREDAELIAEYRTAAPELARECRKHIVERTYFVSKMCDLLGIPDSDNESGVYLAANKLRELRQRIIDAACLRDDVSDDDLVDAVRRLASPSEAQKPRPMSEAPRDGTWVLLIGVGEIAVGRWLEADGLWVDRTLVSISRTVGWLTLPDQGGETKQ